jgi:hypothetical protein
MWHAVTPVTHNYDPIMYERPEPSNVLVLNAGPGIIVAAAWPDIQAYQQTPQITIQLRPGDQRVLGGSLIRAHLHSGDFAAVAWCVLS